MVVSEIHSKQKGKPYNHLFLAEYPAVFTEALGSGTLLWVGPNLYLKFGCDRNWQNVFNNSYDRYNLCRGRSEVWG